MKNLFIVTTAFTLCAISCKKDNEAEYLFTSPTFIECYSNSLFDCTGMQGEEYFNCKLDGKEFCRSTGKDNYVSYYRPTLVVVTNGPTLDLSTRSGRYCLEFGIRHEEETKDEETKLLFNYISPRQATPRQMLDQAFKVGPLRLRSKQNLGDTTDVFDVRIAFRCEQGSYDAGFESGFGAQSDPYLECTRYERTETTDQIIYDITLKFQCDMWHGDHPTTQRLWRKLTEGTMAMRFVVDK
jgi:hypothetical protein